MTQQEFYQRYTYNIRSDKIGGGAFGTVYKAHDQVLHRDVALKISEVKIIGDKEFSLKDEFDAIKDLPPHRNIAHYESMETFETPHGIFDYAIMQYYSDGNLSNAIKSGLNDRQKDEIATDLLQGIQHLHEHKVVHRDLKPGNILIVKHGEKVIPLITDFGLSKQTQQEAMSRFSNSFGGGTLKYSSPEQLKGESIRFNTDLWAFGVIVFELFTGKGLFNSQGTNSASAEAEEEIFKQIKTKDIQPELELLPNKWKPIVAACLIKDADKRIKSSAELIGLLSNSDPNEKVFTEPSRDEPIIDSRKKISAHFDDDAKTKVDVGETEQERNSYDNQPQTKKTTVNAVSVNCDNNDIPNQNSSNRSKWVYMGSGFAILTVILVIVWLVGGTRKQDENSYNANNENIDVELSRNTIESVLDRYYDISIVKDYKELNAIFTNPVEVYYQETNYSIENIVQAYEQYIQTYTFESIELDKSSISLTYDPALNYYETRFYITTTVRNRSKHKTIRLYESIHMKLNTDFKIFYVTETINHRTEIK